MRSLLFKNERKDFYSLLVFQIIGACALGVFALVNCPALLQQFGMKYHLDMGVLQLIVVYNLFLILSICLWSIIWIRKGNIAGIQAGTTIGVLIFLVSMVVFIKFDRIDMLLFDSLRAFLMVIFSYLSYSNFK